MKEILSTLAPDKEPNIAEKRLEYAQEAADATSFANAKAKIYYDARHKPLLLKEDGYQLPGKLNKKLRNQRTGPFLIKKRVGRLAYELELTYFTGQRD